jgi:hypothetical protein
MSQKSMMRCLAPCLIMAAWHPARAASQCSGPGFHQFDFWLGEWQVHRSNGTFAGINLIVQEHDGCVVHEHYATGRGYSGESLNIYDSSRNVWHQTWVDNGGLLLTLEGHLVGKSMVLEGQTRQSDGTIVEQRITWSPNPDGGVRQLWESKGAKGQWTVVFDGRYTKK